MTKDRRLTVTVLTNGEYNATSEYQNRIGYWNTISTTITQRFPFSLIARVASREDYIIRIHAQAS